MSICGSRRWNGQLLPQRPVIRSSHLSTSGVKFFRGLYLLIGLQEKFTDPAGLKYEAILGFRGCIDFGHRR